MDSTERPFDDLLSPISRSSFLRDYWNQRSLHIRGSAHKLTAVRIDRETAFAAIGAAEDPPDVKVQYITADGGHAEFAPPGRDRFALNHQFEAGLTICATDLGRRIPVVDRFARALERQLDHGSRVLASCYVSNVGKGFGLHFDSHPVMVLQCEGSKRWLHGATPAVQGPGHNAVASDMPALVEFVRERPWSNLHVPREQDLEESILHPGDVLYLPAGTWHRTYAEAPSVAWTFTVQQPSWFALLSAALWRQLGRDPVWRTAPQIQPDVASGDRWQQHPEARRVVAAKLRELQHWIGSLTEDDIVGALHPQPISATPALVAQSLVAIQPSDVLTAGPRDQLALITSADEAGQQVLQAYWGHDGVELPAACAPVIERAFAAGQFRAGDVAGWFAPGARPSWADTRAFLGSLVQLGALAPASTGVPPAGP